MGDNILLTILCFAVMVIAPYLISGINSAIIVTKIKTGEDIRTIGSGNAGLTNTLRTQGKLAALFVLLGDILKGVLSILLVHFCFKLLLGVDTYANDGYAWINYCAGVFAVMGHIFPIYYGFKGGKGVLAMFAMMLVCDPPVFLLMLIVFAIIAIGTRLVSMASVMTAIFMPLFIALWYTIMYGDGATAGFRMPIAFLITVVIVCRHIPNIKRIMNREEPRVKMPWEKKKAK